MVERTVNAHRIVQLREEDAARAGAVLARAFYGDPFHVYILPDAGDRERLLPRLYTVAVHFGALSAEAWASLADDGEIAAVAIGIRYPRPAIDPEHLARSGTDKLPEVLGAEAWSRFDEVGRAVRAAQVRVLPEPHWELVVLGTDPHRQRQGYGSALLDHFSARAAADGLPATLWTHAPLNVPFYERHGYAVIAEGTEATSGLDYWIFGGQT